MRHLKREKSTPRFVPDYLVTSIGDIDFEHLRAKGVRFVAFDADSTLVHYRGKKLSKDIQALLIKQRTLFDGWCIASNRITNDLLPLASSIDAQVIRATLLVRKPQQKFFRQVIQHFGNPKPGTIAMIGDKLIADMYGGKRAGMTTVWIEHFGRDGFLDRLFHVRRFERKLMQKYMVQEKK